MYNYNFALPTSLVDCDLEYLWRNILQISNASEDGLSSEI